jgi:hypothetical protein
MNFASFINNKKTISMKKKTFFKLTAFIFLAVFSLTGFAQDDLGVACGCPPVSARTTSVNLSTNVINGLIDPQLSADLHLTCDKIWILDQKIYVPKGKTITIDPGTVIKGTPTAVGDPSNASALIIERVGKLWQTAQAKPQLYLLHLMILWMAHIP